MTINKDIFYYIIALVIFILLKYSFTLADTNDLLFLLKPTNKAVSLLTGSQSIMIEGKGYFYQQLNIIIDKSCSGFNFWLLCFMMLFFQSLNYFKTTLGKVSVLLLSFIGAFILTVFVNSSRIFTLIIIQRQELSYATSPVFHEAIGIITNLSFLILIYLSVEKILITQFRNAKLT